MLSCAVSCRPITLVGRNFNVKNIRFKLQHPSPFQFFRSLAHKVVAPRAQLNDWYMKEYGVGLTNESSFKFEEHLRDGKVWWTARFICPKTQEIYEAGTLSDEDFYDIWPWSKGSKRIPIQVENKFYYQRLKTALHAAAARKLDAIYLENEPNKLQFCAEDPILYLETLDSVSSTTEYTLKTEYDQKIPYESEHKELVVTTNIEKNVLPDMEIARRSPKVALHSYYSKMNQTLKNDIFESRLYREVRNNMESAWWSTNFVCPLSGKEYTSGSLINEEIFGEVRYLRGRPFYTRLKSAVNAAAALALDDIFLKLTGRKGKLCREDSSLVDALYLHPDHDNRQLNETLKFRDTIAVTYLGEDSDEFEQFSLEGLTIQPLESSMIQSNTLDKVMEAWSDSVLPAKTSRSSHYSFALIDRTPAEKRKKIVKGVESWVRRLQHQDDTSDRFVQFQNCLHDSSLIACNVILSALVKANEINNGADIQEIADNVLNFLWSGPKPNADTYNAYMQCLHGDPLIVAEMAHKILQDMLSEKNVINKSKIPSPNVKTFHTVMKLWAKAGDAGRCQSVLQLMNQNEMKSDQRVYEILLSSFVHGRFDRKMVLNVIKDMERNEIFSKKMYYCPLRWGSKQCPAGFISWDIFKKNHDGKFRKEPIEEDIFEVKQVEAWLALIEQQPHLELTIGCYEAVIQGWIRTGTLDGFKKAELWAQRCLENASENLQPRLQTFFPILSASIYLNEGPEKINEWVNELEKHSMSYPQLRPDGRVKSMIVLAWRQYQESICKDRELEKAKFVATESSIELERICNQLMDYHLHGKGNLFFVETATFCDVASCWATYLQMLIRQGCKHEAKNAASRVLEIGSLYQRLIRDIKGLLLHRDDTLMEEKSEESNSETSTLYLQLCHLLYRASDLYFLVLSSVFEMEQTYSLHIVEDKGFECKLFVKYLVETEGMLRSSYEMHRLLQTLGRAKLGYDPYYNDDYPHHEEAEKYRTTQTQLCTIIATMLSKEDTGKKYLGDKIRILMLVLRIIAEKESFNKGQISHLFIDTVKVLQHLENDFEREVLLKHLFWAISENSNVEPAELSDIFGSIEEKKSNEQMLEEPTTTSNRIHRN